MSSEFIDILLFGAIAVFLVYRLRSILGSTDGKIVNLKTKKTQTAFKPKIVPKNDNDEFLKGPEQPLSQTDRTWAYVAGRHKYFVEI